MASLTRVIAPLFLSSLTGCASLPPPQPEFASIADGCGTMNRQTGQIVSMSVECLAQKQLQAETKGQSEIRKSEIAAAADLTKTIIKQPPAKNPQAQNVAIALGILKVEEMAKNSGLSTSELQALMPKGWNPRLVDQAAGLVRSVFGGLCSYDTKENYWICYRDKATPAPALAPASAASGASPQ